MENCPPHQRVEGCTIKCPMCGSDNIKTVDSRSDLDSIVRRKKCLVCNHRWYTIEIDKDQWYSALKIKEERKRGRPKDD